MLALSACAGAGGLPEGAEWPHAPLPQLAKRPALPGGSPGLGTSLSPAEMRTVAGLSSAGYQRLLALDVKGFVADGDRVAHPFTVDADRCVLLLIFASRGITDVDLAVYSAEGELLALDDRLDAKPALWICAQHSRRRVYALLHAYQGAGTVRLMGFSGGVEGLAKVGEVLSTMPIRAELHNERPRGEAQVHILRVRLQRSGFRLVQDALQLQLVKAQPMATGLDAKAGHCYAVAVFSERDHGALTLRILGPTGAELRRAWTSAAEVAESRFCAPNEAQMVIETLADSPQGANATVLVFEAKAHDLRASAGLWPEDAAQQYAGKYSSSSRYPTGDNRMVAPPARLSGAWSAQLMPGQVLEQTVWLPHRGCFHLDAQPSPQLQAFQAFWVRPGSQLERSDTVCVPRAQKARLRVQAVRGTGSIECRWQQVAPVLTDDQLSEGSLYVPFDSGQR